VIQVGGCFKRSCRDASLGRLPGILEDLWTQEALADKEPLYSTFLASKRTPEKLPGLKVLSTC
jgi:hypothetical protein